MGEKKQRKAMKSMARLLLTHEAQLESLKLTIQSQAEAHRVTVDTFSAGMESLHTKINNFDNNAGTKYQWLRDDLNEKIARLREEINDLESSLLQDKGEPEPDPDPTPQLTPAVVE